MTAIIGVGLFWTGAVVGAITMAMLCAASRDDERHGRR